MVFLNKKCLGGYFHRLFEKKGIAYYPVSSEDEIEDCKKNIYITSQKNRFVHKCPGTKEYRCCNYMVVDVVEGCPFDCSYCILQVYLNNDFIKVYDDLEEIIYNVKQLDKKGRFRLGTGELSDSLALDHILYLTDFFIPLINECENIRFEFKTKSDNIKNLFNHDPKNILVSFSLNPQEIVSSEEHFTVSVSRRIFAAKALTEYGYKVGFHFDPLIDWDNFEGLYADLIEDLFDNIAEKDVEFISISSFRFIPELADIIRIKFPHTKILANTFVKSLDGKMRYFKGKRFKMLSFIYSKIRSSWKDVFIYFCMEDETIWRRVIGYDPGDREKFEAYFNWKRV
ncbi:MAG: DNA photolyase [Calditerrivibrio sp.]|nr:DNA photolyase [Calditerrivibrio sp.]